jgi:cell division topological specificity factor
LPTDPVARERLQIFLAHERSARGKPDLLATLREEILVLVATHVSVEDDNVLIKMDRGDTVSTLEIDIEIPNSRASSWRVPSGERRALASVGPKPHRGESARTLRSNRRSNGRRVFGTWLAQRMTAAPDRLDVALTA